MFSPSNIYTLATTTTSGVAGTVNVASDTVVYIRPLTPSETASIATAACVVGYCPQVSGSTGEPIEVYSSTAAATINTDLETTFQATVTAINGIALNASQTWYFGASLIYAPSLVTLGSGSQFSMDYQTIYVYTASESVTTIKDRIAAAKAAADLPADVMKTGVTNTGSFGYTGVITHGITTGITAFAGGGQASATALTTTFNDVTTVSTAGDSVKLIAAVAGISQTVKNSGGAALAIFPASGDSINALAADLAVWIQPGSEITFFAKDATVWESSEDETVTVLARTSLTGALVLKATPSVGNFTTTITNASQAAARIYTVPDAGAAADFVMSEGAQTINGAKTFSANTTISGALIQGVAAITGPGAIPITASVVTVRTTGADAYTIADGANGQELTIVMIVDGGDGTITPTTKTGFTTITLDAVGDSVTLRFFTTLGWMVTSNYNATIA